MIQRQHLHRVWLGAGIGLVLGGCVTSQVAQNPNLKCQPDCEPQLVNRIRVGTNPVGVAVSEDGSVVYVANRGSDSISKISTASMQVVSTITISGSPVWIALAPNRPYLCVTARDSHMLNLIDRQGNYILNAIDLTYTPERVVVHPTKNIAYVGCGGSANLLVVDLDQAKVVQNVATQNECLGLALSADGSTLWVGTRSPRFNLMVFSTKDMSLITRNNAGSMPVDIVISTNGEYAYASNYTSNDLTLVHIPTFHPVLTVPLASGPVDLAISPKGRYLYASCQMDNSVLIFDTTTNQVVGRLSLDISPYGIALDPQNARLFVANYEKKSSEWNASGKYGPSSNVTSNTSGNINNNMLLVFDLQKYRE